MIGRADIATRVREWGLREDLVEKDYVLGWALWGIGSDPELSARWAFKGGTCLMAYLRVATHPAVFARPLSLAEAMGNVDGLLARPHVRTAGEGEAFWLRFRELAVDARPTGNLVPDAHLAALMLEHGVGTIVTRDRDFRRFRGFAVEDPFA